MDRVTAIWTKRRYGGTYTRVRCVVRGYIWIWDLPISCATSAPIWRRHANRILAQCHDAPLDEILGCVIKELEHAKTT